MRNSSAIVDLFICFGAKMMLLAGANWRFPDQQSVNPEKEGLMKGRWRFGGCESFLLYSLMKKLVTNSKPTRNTILFVYNAPLVSSRGSYIAISSVPYILHGMQKCWLVIVVRSISSHASDSFLKATFEETSVVR